MKKSKNKNATPAVNIISLIFLFILFSCNNKTNDKNSKVVSWNLDSCYYFTVIDVSKCQDCETYLEFYISINNETNGDFKLNKYDNSNSIINSKKTLKIHINNLVFDCKHEVESSLTIKKGTSFILAIQPDINQIQFGNITKEKYDEYLRNMADISELTYSIGDSIIKINKVLNYKVIER